MSAEDRDGSSIRARQAVGEMIEVQRRIFNRQKRLVDARETHRKKGFTRYRREYRKAHHAGRLRTLVAQSRNKKSPDAEDLAAQFALEHLS